MTLFSAALLLILVMDPFGNIPFFLSALKNVEPRRRQWIIAREMLIALAVLVAFLFLGQPLLNLLQISGPALTVAGGAVLMIIAIKMVFPMLGKSVQEIVEGEPFIVPLAIPYIAGPSAMASVLLIMNRQPDRWLEWLAAVGLAWSVSGAILFSSGFLSRYIEDKFFIAMERLMGLVLVAISVEMIMGGVARYIKSLT